MTSWMRWLVGGMLVMAGGWLTAALSVAAWQVPDADQAVIRLAWSGRPERLEHCRRLTDAELEGVPAHMRERVHCEGRSARYRLDLAFDGRPVLGDTLYGGGLRHDRPMHILRDIRLPAGLYRVTLGVTRLDSTLGGVDTLTGPRSDTGATLGSASRDQRERDERERARREALPSILGLDTVLTLEAGGITVITYAPEQRQFMLLDRDRGDQPPPRRP